VMTSWR